MALVEQILYSGGGFIAGVMATLIYAKATGHALQPPWRKEDSLGS